MAAADADVADDEPRGRIEDERLAVLFEIPTRSAHRSGSGLRMQSCSSRSRGWPACRGARDRPARRPARPVAGAGRSGRRSCPGPDARHSGCPHRSPSAMTSTSRSSTTISDPHPGMGGQKASISGGRMSTITAPGTFSFRRPRMLRCANSPRRPGPPASRQAAGRGGRPGSRPPPSVRRRYGWCGSGGGRRAAPPAARSSRSPSRARGPAAARAVRKPPASRHGKEDGRGHRASGCR